MKRLTNEKLKKEFKKVTYNLIIGLTCIVLAMVCYAAAYISDHQEPKDSKYLNDVIESDEKNREDIDVNLKVTLTPVQFARLSNDTSKKLYITMDDKYFYIVALTDSKYNELKNKDLNKEPITIYGKTKPISSSIQSLALKYYNNSVDEEYQIKNGDFYKKFGDLYLDATETNTTSTVLYVVGAFSNLCGVCFLIVFGVIKFKVEKAIKKFDDEELKKIEDEIDEKESFHYERAHLILTRNYIISCLNGLNILKYEDIIWVYEYRLRQYGITTQKSIMVMNNQGKVKPIITLDGVTKKSKMVFEEIADTILSKNDKILVGYNKENKKKIKEDYGF